ncbi:serine/threonine-protein phosphatase 7 long form [Cinnamomum micranthum f. kanehirae]|uniref:Serine/threonine-protein phosphatase 7 long form n=1 Tax=Cinnamomum micranthum f. kanehirae TaxID=337451 RepID=A0A3S3NSW6_9MAGN|nr:serine/threonine-protein phosphatase 7 long form [Cinnamomum micranthum f. kanehirae]
MAKTRLAGKRTSTLDESGEGASGDQGGIPLNRFGEDPEVGLAGEPEAGQNVTRPAKRRKRQQTREDPHLADEIRAGKLVPLARTRVGWLKVKQWWTELSDTLKDRIRAMGFGDFMSIVAFRPDRALLSALSERWRDETHSFHFPTGEMTITLEDIARCWGLRVICLPVSTGTADANPDLVRPLLQRLFGARPYLGSSQVDIEWLWEAYGPARAKALNSWTRDQTEFLAGHEAQVAAVGDSSARDGDSGTAPTTSEWVRTDAADAIRPDVGIDENEGATSDSDDEDYIAPLDELLASDDSDDPMDVGGSEDEGDGHEARAGDDEGGDDVVPLTEYECREVPVDGYYRRKRVGIPCKAFYVTRKKGTRSDVALRRPRLLSARQGEEESLRAFLLYFLGKCLFANSTGSRVSVTLLRFVDDLSRVGDYAWGAAALAFLFHSLDDRCRVQRGHRSLRGFVPIIQVWMWEHVLQCRPERLPVRLGLVPRAAQWYPNATMRGFADIRPIELAKRTKDLRMRPDEQGYRFILNELIDREIIWRPYQSGPDDELMAVREGKHLFATDIWLHAPQIVSRLVVSRVARQFGSHQVVLPPEPVMGHSYRGWGEAIFGHSHPHQPEIDDWDRGGQTPTFGTDEEASGNYERYWKEATCRFILPESYSGGSSYSVRNCAEAIEAMMSLREAMTTGLQASFAAKEMDLRKELRLRDAIIDALTDTYERDKDLAASEAVRIRLEGELRTLRTEMDRLRAEACDKCDKALAEKNASEAQVEELQAKLKSFEASTQGGAIVVSAPSLLSSSEDRARIHDQYAEHMDRM